MREHNTLDRWIDAADQTLRAVVGTSQATRNMPTCETADDGALPEDEKNYAARLMRINHAGEIAAQGLYHGQACTARNRQTAERMRRNAHQETDHLAWCRQRLGQLGGRVSLLTPLWYAGSFAIGAAAGLAGDRHSLGFVKETEDQVVRHLESHLAKVPTHDKTTLAVIEQIKRDEAEHADSAAQAGASELPQAIRSLMNITSKVMTTTAYYF